MSAIKLYWRVCRLLPSRLRAFPVLIRKDIAALRRDSGPFGFRSACIAEKLTFRHCYSREQIDSRKHWFKPYEATDAAEVGALMPLMT